MKKYRHAGSVVVKLCTSNSEVQIREACGQNDNIKKDVRRKYETMGSLI